MTCNKCKGNSNVMCVCGLCTKCSDEKHGKSKVEIEYKCGHKTDGLIILDCNELSYASWLVWSKSVGVFGDKSKCFNCYFK